MPRHLWFLISAAIVGLAAGSASAGKAANRARKHFKKGERYYQQGEFRKALSEYKKAHQAKAHPAFIFNVAQCHRQLGEYKKALFFYRLYLSEAPKSSNRDEVVLRVNEMEQKVAERTRKEQQKGKVSVVTKPSGASVHVDRFEGPPLASTPAVVKLPPGRHMVVIRKKGFKPVHRSVNVRPGGMLVINVELRLVAPAVVRVRRTKPFYKRWWFWTGVAVAGALAVAGAATGAMTMMKVDDWEKHHDPNDRTLGKQLRTTTDVLLGAALLTAVGVTIGAAIVGRGKRSETPKAMIVPSCNGSGCGIYAAGRF